MRVIVHEGVVHMPQIRGEHWWNHAQSERIIIVSVCWPLNLSERIADIHSVEVGNSSTWVDLVT